MPVHVTQANCFARYPDESAACQKSLLSSTPAVTETDYGNWNAAYPPVYYWVMGWLVTDSFELSIVLMRALAALVVLALVLWLVAVLPGRLRHAAAVPLVLLSVPLGLFLVSSNNPSGWAIGGAGVTWLALHASFSADRTQRAHLLVIAVVGAVIGAGSRADAGLFTIFGVLLALLLNWSTVRTRVASVVTGGVCVAVAAGLFLLAGQSSALAEGLDPDQVLGEDARMSWFELAVFNLGQLPSLWTGVLGVGSLGTTGHLDTRFPALVGFVGLVCALSVIQTSWGSRQRRYVLAIGLVALALCAYPLYILGRTGLTVGQGVQPRYLLPLFVILVGLVLAYGGPRLTRRQATSVGLGLSLAHAVALHVEMRRYLTGLDVSQLSLDAGREWWWEVAPTPNVVWAVGTVAFLVTALRAMELAVDREPAGTAAGDLLPVGERVQTGPADEGSR